MPILSAVDRQHFIERGFVVVKNGISSEWLSEWQQLAWHRLETEKQVHRDDPTTWPERVHLNPSRVAPLEGRGPRAFEAMGELLGGRERIQEPLFWGDVFVCNFHLWADEPLRAPSAGCPEWHKDGYFFKHFLDSPEQALLVFAAWTDVVDGGGATFIAPDSVGVISKYLAEHPEGVKANVFGKMVSECREFEQVTARAGDVVLLHPFMLHTASQNVRRVPRIISNPIVLLQEPMNFNRKDGNYSLVEAATLRAMGVEALDFKRTGESETRFPGWVQRAFETPQNELGTLRLEF